MLDKDLLSIAGWLYYFDSIIRGRKILVWTNYKNWTFANTTIHQSQRVLQQKIMVSQDYNAEIEYIVGKDNLGAYALCRLTTKAS